MAVVGIKSVKINSIIIFVLSKMTPQLPQTNFLALLLLLVGRRKRFKIVGQSMLPLLEQGEEVLIDPYAYSKSQPQVNDIVVTNHPWNTQLTIVKRVTEVAVDGSYFLRGDNPASSTDSRQWGLVNRSKIIGKVTNRFI